MQDDSRPQLYRIAGPGGQRVADWLPGSLRIATYNVHRWQGPSGRAKPNVERAGAVIRNLDADVIGLQEVLRPASAEVDPLERLSEALGVHVVFAMTRQHRLGELGNAILSRYPISECNMVDISHSRLESRGALAARVGPPDASLGLVVTHLSLVDRTRHRQVQSLLAHEALNSGPTVLLGDMNAWRNCRGTRAFDASLNLHHNMNWPASFPAVAPLLALDRIYTRHLRVETTESYDSPEARKASDHLPVVADVRIDVEEMRAHEARRQG